MCHKAANAKWYAENTERAKATSAKWKAENTERVKVYGAKWYAENTERVKVYGAKWQADSRQKGLQILGTCCAWSDLAGCEGDIEVDHIIPPGLRRTTGYTSYGYSLILWIRANPALAKVRLQLLCNEHNRFKYDKPNHEARAEWSIKHPITWRLFE